MSDCGCSCPGKPLRVPDQKEVVVDNNILRETRKIEIEHRGFAVWWWDVYFCDSKGNWTHEKGGSALSKRAALRCANRYSRGTIGA